MRIRQRKFISIYFKDGLLNNRKKRDFTISLSAESSLYKKCKHLNSSAIKKLIGIDSYAVLLKKSNQDGRTLSNYIKYKLNQKLVGK
jgi:hypothetical protein